MRRPNRDSANGREPGIIYERRAGARPAATNWYQVGRDERPPRRAIQPFCAASLGDRCRAAAARTARPATSYRRPLGRDNGGGWRSASGWVASPAWTAVYAGHDGAGFD